METAFNAIYDRVKGEYKKMLPELVKYNEGLHEEDQCWAVRVDIDKELFDVLKERLEKDGFECYNADTPTTDEVEWIMGFDIEPKDTSRLLPEHW